MLNFENAKIVKKVVSDINFDSLMVEGVALSDNELIPSNDATKQSVIIAKQKFDNGVNA